MPSYSIGTDLYYGHKIYTMKKLYRNITTVTTRTSAYGFTLIELLVVISIIALLSSIVLASLSGVRYKAQLANMQEGATAIINQIEYTRLAKNETLYTILNNAGDLNSIIANWVPYSVGQNTLWFGPDYGDTVEKLAQYPNFITINQKSWADLGFNNPPLDPWGTPYVLGATEGTVDPDSGTSTCWSYDVAYSAGPNGILDTVTDSPNDISPPGVIETEPSQYGYNGTTDDDLFFTIPFFNCEGLPTDPGII